MAEEPVRAAIDVDRDAVSSRKMWEFHSGLRMGFMLSAVAEIGVADHLVEGPLPVVELAERTHSDADSLYRVLRALASQGVFTEVSRRAFGLTPLAAILRSDSPDSLRDVFRLQGQKFMRDAYADIGYSIRTGEPAFDQVNGVELFEYLAGHPEMNDLFSRAMGNTARQTQRAAVEAYDLTGVGRLVDVGGAHGHLLASILTRYPDMAGVVFDQPHVVVGAERVLREAGVLDRAKLIGGDYLDSVPAGGDVYVISHVLHQLSDADAITVLTNVRRAMSEVGRVLVIDPVIPEGDVPHPGKFMDITMLALSRGRDRSEEEFADVFEKAGLRLADIIGLAAPSSVVVAVPSLTEPRNSERIMTDRIALDDLRSILVEAAGGAEATAPDEELLDVDLYELGYDSLALIEVGARIKDRFGVAIPDDKLTDLRTFRLILDRVNATEEGEQ